MPRDSTLSYDCPAGWMLFGTIAFTVAAFLLVR